jgi:hypothetical protein
MRALFVTLFLINLGGWVWIVVAVPSMPGSNDAASLALDQECADVGGLQLQVHVGRAFRDAAIRWNRERAICETILIVDALGILAAIVFHEAGRRKGLEEGKGGQAPF